MTIDSLKDLEKLIKLCRKSGVSTIRVDGIDLVLSPIESQRPPKVSYEHQDPMASLEVPTPNIQDPIAAAKAEAAKQLKAIQDYIQTDEMSEEQQMFYSTRPEAPPEQ